MQKQNIGDFVDVILNKADGAKLPYVEIGDIDVSTKKYSLKDKPAVEGALKANKDCVLISKVRPTRGAVSIVQNDCYVSNAFVILKARQALIPEFLFYLIAYDNNFFSYLGRLEKGTSYPSCRAKDILSYKISVPSKVDQEQIVKVLRQADALRQKRKQSLQLLDDFLRATFLDMFGDPLSNSKKLSQKKIGDIGEIITGNTPFRLKSEYYGNHIEWIKSDNINTPQFILTKAKEYLSREGLKVGRLAPKGSVLVTCIAGSPECIGNIAMADRDVAFNQQINAFVPGKEISQKVFFAQIHFFKQLIQQASTNSMKGMVSKSKFSEIQVLVPPKEVQKQFDDIFDKVYFIRSQNQQSESEFDNQFNALTQRYFG
jgi:type I restriction enzyme S subunit